MNEKDKRNITDNKYEVLLLKAIDKHNELLKKLCKVSSLI